jgi:hypothetical protein
MNNEEENAVYITSNVDPITVVLGILSAIALVWANVFIFTMITGSDNFWIKPVIGILFNFLWVNSWSRWIIHPLKQE